MKLWRTLLRLFKKFAPSVVRVVVDTNVLVSGTIVRYGASSRIVDTALVREITLITSQTLLDEYLDAVHRRHIAKRYRNIAPRVQNVADFLRRRAVHVKGRVIEPVLSDPDDDFILACAVEGKANYIVSGDDHLLKLGRYRGIKILTPRDFVVDVLGEDISTPR